MWRLQPLPALLLATFVAGPGVAFAQDGDDGDLLDEDVDIFEDDGEEDLDWPDEDLEDLQDAELPDAGEDDSEGRIEEDDDLDTLGDEETDDGALDEFVEDEEDSFDLLDDEKEEEVSVGSDTAQIYRDAQAAARQMAADEEVAAWEEYLATYPDTAFRQRIEDRIDSLMDSLYTTRIDSGEVEVDALDEEIYLAQALLLENINPRSRLQAAFEWGLPSYINLVVDYEHALRRDLSVHAGVRRRYHGWSIEPGVRWAIIKSSRTQSIFTFIGDVHFNTNPAYPGIRPQLAYGKKFGKLDAQVQGGVDFEVRDPLGLRVIGGASATYLASNTVGMFLESSVHMKNFGWEGGIFRFNVVTFGMKFFPGRRAADGVDPQANRQSEVNVGASVPYTTNYWQYHYGSIMGQVNYYTD